MRGRVFLSGESAGGNIVHNVVLRKLQEKSRDQVKVKRVVDKSSFIWE